MRTADVESSLFKYLYENLEVLYGIHIVEDITFVNFATYTSWVVIDSLTHTTGAVPKALYFLHIASKAGNLNDIQILNRLADRVMDIINVGAYINVYDDSSGILLGVMEVCETSLTPIIKHPDGGNYRSLTVGLVYAGMVPT